MLLPLQISMKPYLVKSHHFKLGIDHVSSVTAVPNGNIFLFVIWGNGDWDHHRVAPTRMAKKGGIYVLGQHFEINNFSAKADLMDILGFELSPVVFHQLFGISQKHLLNRLFCLEELGVRETSGIYFQVREEISLANQLSVMENFFWARIQSSNKQWNDVLCQAIGLIDQCHGNICIRKLADTIRICTRSLERRFLQVLGVTPKTYCKIIQFNYAFHLLIQTDKRIVDIAHDAGYYDQSHFINHFRKVCGMCPSRFWAEHQLLYCNRKANIIETELPTRTGIYHFHDKIYFH